MSYRTAAPKPPPDPEPPGPTAYDRVARIARRVRAAVWPLSFPGKVLWLLCALAGTGVAALVYWEQKHPCLRGHIERQWVHPPPILVKSGDIWIPIHQPPYQADVFICEERAP